MKKRRAQRNIRLVIIIAVAAAAAVILIAVFALPKGDKTTKKKEDSLISEMESTSDGTDADKTDEPDAGSLPSVTSDVTSLNKDDIRASMIKIAYIISQYPTDPDYGVLPYLAPYMSDDGLISMQKIISPSRNLTGEDITAIRTKSEEVKDYASMHMGSDDSSVAIEDEGDGIAHAVGIISFGSGSYETGEVLLDIGFISENGEWAAYEIGELRSIS